jgi:hypothetical protein
MSPRQVLFCTITLNQTICATPIGMKLNVQAIVALCRLHRRHALEVDNAGCRGGIIGLAVVRYIREMAHIIVSGDVCRCDGHGGFDDCFYIHATTCG